MTIILNKIDPLIVNDVQKQTADGVVHSSERTRVAKDSKKKSGERYPNKKMKDKLDKFNHLLSEMGIDQNFIIDDDCITAVDKDGNIIRKYTKEEIDELFVKMGKMIGIFVDTRK